VYLSWVDNSNNEQGFYIDRSTGAGSYTRIKTLDANTTRYIDDAVTSNTSYNYKIESFIGSNYSLSEALSVATPVATVFAAQYNGNIAYMEWGAFDNKGDGLGSEIRGYNFKYDALNRLTSSAYKVSAIETGATNETGFSYDLNGNIMGLQRVKLIGTVPKTIDMLEYSYPVASNQLAKVTDYGDKTAGFIDGPGIADDYGYDPNGNLTSDNNKNITLITYNYLNLPFEITFSDGAKIKYIYDATGDKLQKITTPASGPATTINYCGEMEFTGTALSLIHTEEGAVTYNQSGVGTYQYFLRDHLGNTRVVIDQAGTIT
jgi:hypothetical protein